METPENAATKPVWQDARAIALLMAASLTTMANATISPALPGLERLFASDPNAAMLTRLLVPAPSLAVALCAPFAGLAIDHFGRRFLLLFGIVLFVLAGTAGLFLPSLQAIFASRIVLGVAVALIMTTQTALIGDYFTGSARNALTGLQISARNFGGLVFISLAGWVAAMSPRLPFAIYALAAAFLPLMWKVIVDLPRSLPAPDARARQDTATPTAWAWRLALLVVLQGVTNMIFFVMPTQTSFFLEASGYDAALMTGATLGTVMLSGGMLALAYPRIQRVVGYAGIFVSGYAAIALGFVSMPLAVAPPFLFAAAAMIGAGYALVSPSFVALALNLAPSSRRGVAGGFLTASIFIGQFCSPLATTPLIAHTGYDGLFRILAIVVATMALAAALSAYANRLRRRSAGQPASTSPLP